MEAEIKEMLKTAKDAIKNKDCNSALKICKSIIDKDKTNYLAWVMTGAAAFEIGSRDQALAAYHKAIQLSPNQAPAWQGIAQYYEKVNPTSSELTGIYSELRKLFQSDATRHNDYSIKFANALCNQGKYNQAVVVYYDLLKEKFKKADDSVPISLDENSFKLVESLIRLLGDPTIIDVSTDVFKEVLRFIRLKEESTQSPLLNRLDKESVLRIHENAINAMVRVGNDWQEIESLCLSVLRNYDDRNEISLTILLDIYSEILICSKEFSSLSTKTNASLDNLLLNNLNQAAGILELKKTFIDLIKQSISDDFSPSNPKYLAEFKSNLNKFNHKLGELKSLQQQISEICLAFVESNYYSSVCDHGNTTRTSDRGINLLNSSAEKGILIVKPLKQLLLFRFHANKAFTYLIARDYKKAIELCLKAESIAAQSNNGMLGDEEFEKSDLNYERRANLLCHLIEAYFGTDNSIEAGKTHDKLKTLLNGQALKRYSDLAELLVSIFEKFNQTTYDLAESLIESYPNDYEFHFRFARFVYDILVEKLNLNDLKDSTSLKNQFSEFTVGVDQLKNTFFNTIVTTIRLNSYRWEPVFIFGNYYRYLMNDFKRALKCLQKSYELCQNLNLCGLQLIDALLNEKEDAIAFNLLKKAVIEIENCKWASVRLGIIYLKKGDSNEAIKLFHSVIRNDSEDYNMWECLADAYLARGSSTAALKSFSKAYELNPSSIYACYQIAHIKQTLNLYDEAVLDYFAVLNKIPNHIPTLKGLGETYFQMAKLNSKTSNDNKYLHLAEQSIKYAAKAIYLRKDLSCLWKIVGDSCSLARCIPSKHIDTINIDKCLADKTFTTSSINNTEQIQLNKFQMIKFAEEAYKICCKLKPKCGSYWFDLGSNYFIQFEMDKMASGSSSGGDREKLTKSIDCVVNAINLEPTNAEFWNMLGIIYSRQSLVSTKAEQNKNNLAQHCFLKSLQLDENSAKYWTNLGVFYLINDEFKLAHECFKKSQAIDPEFNIAWIGQAYIAETVDIEQSIDLYRHSVELMMHTEAEYGYSRIVAIIANDLELRNSVIYTDYIEYLNAESLASDCLVKYADRIDTNPDAYFLGGIMFEKLSMPQTSISFYEKSIKLYENLNESAEGTAAALMLNENTTEASKILLMARRGYARVLCSLGRFEDALLQYKKIIVKDSIDDLFTLGRVFFKLGKHQQAFKIFESALGVANENEISTVYAAMGMAQSKISVQESIAWFFKSLQSKVVCIQSLFALCSIGLLKNDNQLIKAVFVELDKLVDDKKYRFDIFKLKSIYYCLKKEFPKAIRCMSKYVHENPTEAKCWIELCMCLRRAKNYELALTICNIIVFKLNATDASKCTAVDASSSSSSNNGIYECLQYLLLQNLIKNNYVDKNSYLLGTFKKTLHRCPANMVSWQIFKQFMSNYSNVKDVLNLVEINNNDARLVG